MAKIETFDDDFSDLSNWEAVDIAPTGFAKYSVSGGQLVCDVSGTYPSAGGAMQTAEDYEFEDSWFSWRCVDFESDPVDEMYVPVTAYVFDPAVTGIYDSLSVYINYGTPGDTRLSLGHVDGVSTIPNPTGPFVVALRDIGGTVFGYYSLDDGATWSDIGTGTGVPSIRPDNSPFKMLIQTIVLADNAGPDSTMILDSLNEHEPPLPSVPLEIDVDTAMVTVDAKNVTVIVGPFIAVDADAASVVISGPALDSVVLGIVQDVDPQDVTVEAVPHDSITLGEYYVSFTPAQPFVRAIPPGVTLGEPSPVIDVYPDVVGVVAVDIPDPIVGDFEPGDPFHYPIVIRESGSRTFDMSDFTVESGELGYDHTLHLLYEADAPMQVTFAITSDDAMFTSLAVVDGDTVADISNEAAVGISDPLVYDVNTGYTRLRIMNSTGDPVTLTWSYSPVNTPLFMEVLTPVLDRTPESLKVAIQGGAPGETIRFRWNPPLSTYIPGATPRPITLATITADFEGNILVGSLPIPAAPAGNYIIEATGLTSGFLADDDFKILNNPLPQDTGSVDVEPVASVSTKWLWDDGAGHTWVMDINPERMTSVIESKILMAERTTSGNGQHIIWQGATPAVDWGFNGIVMSQSEYEEFEYFYSLDRKFYITTHRNKTYVVTFKSLNMTPKKNGANFWTFTYEASLFLFGEKV